MPVIIERALEFILVSSLALQKWPPVVYGRWIIGHQHDERSIISYSASAAPAICEESDLQPY